MRSMSHEESTTVGTPMEPSKRAAEQTQSRARLVAPPPAKTGERGARPRSGDGRAVPAGRKRATAEHTQCTRGARAPQPAAPKAGNEGTTTAKCGAEQEKAPHEHNTSRRRRTTPKAVAAAVAADAAGLQAATRWRQPGRCEPHWRAQSCTCQQSSPWCSSDWARLPRQ